ncbi:MAG TPA: hypothetical protein EYG86_05575 [Crocinitomicaceae bacterium]|nr:hypothetical protein [Crocinitomicaceae bacterium]
MSKIEQSPEERKQFLAELNQIARYTGEILHGEELSKVRIRQLKKYFNKTYNLLHRLSAIEGEITNKSFRYCYGGKLLGRKVLLDLGFVKKEQTVERKTTYLFLLSKEEINLEIVSRIIVEVYLSRNDIREI